MTVPRLSRVLLLALVAAFAARAPVRAQPGYPLSQSFDDDAPPSLPYGWVTTNAGSGPLWITDTTYADSAPNAAHVDDPDAVADMRLDSAPFVVRTNSAQLWFRHVHDFRIDQAIFPDDGGVLEISIDGQPFQDIVDAGGQLVVADNQIVLGNDQNPLFGRRVFALKNPSFPAFDTVIVNLPPTPGSTVVLRWRMGSSDLTPLFVPTGWWIDSVRVCDGFACGAAALPTRLRVDTAGNGVLEPGETVSLEPAYYNGDSEPIEPSGQLADMFGPPGTSLVAVDGLASYGTIPPGESAGCADVGDCYSVTLNDPGTRPVQHWDAQVLEDLSVGGVMNWAVHIGGSFADVPASNLFYKDIETVFHRGVTGGCGAQNYCPSDPALRRQMAVFLLKSLYGAAYVPPPAAGIFADVPASDPFAPWVENLYALGITGGCAISPLRYCPDAAVLRRQMAVFLLKGLHGPGYAPPPCTGVFADVPCPSPFADWIEDLHSRQIAAGCGGGNFCPADPNTRGQMAVFLDKTFGLTLYGP